MFSKPLCTLIRSILYDNKSRSLSVLVGQMFVLSLYRFVPVGLCLLAYLFVCWFVCLFSLFSYFFFLFNRSFSHSIVCSSHLFLKNIRFLILGLSSIPLQFSIQPQNKTTLAGNKTLLECLTARKNVDYTWKHNNKDIKFDHRIFKVAGRSLRISNTSLADIGKYTCVVKDKNNHGLISTSSYLLVRGKQLTYMLFEVFAW